VPTVGVVTDWVGFYKGMFQQLLDLFKPHWQPILIAGLVCILPAAFVGSCVETIVMLPATLSMKSAESKSDKAVKEAEAAAKKLEEQADKGEIDMAAVAEANAKALKAAAEATEAAGTAVGGGFLAILLGFIARLLFGFIVNGIAVPLACLACSLVLFDRCMGGPGDWKVAWARVKSRQSALIGALLIPAAAIALATMLSGYAALVGYLFLFVPLIAVFEGTGGVDVLKRAYEMLMRDYMLVLFASLLLYIPWAILSIVFGLVFGWIPFVGTILHNLLAFAILPIPLSIFGLAYLDGRRKEGFTPQQLLHQMDGMQA